MNCSYEHMGWSPEMRGKLDVFNRKIRFSKVECWTRAFSL